MIIKKIYEICVKLKAVHQYLSNTSTYVTLRFSQCNYNNNVQTQPLRTYLKMLFLLHTNRVYAQSEA